jgi:hypothetical protein
MIELNQIEKQMLINGLVQHDLKINAALKDTSDVSYGWSLLVQEQQRVQNLIAKLENYNAKVTSFDEAKHEAFIERRMNMLDKKLMQGHISQDDYESMVKSLNEVTL